MNQRLPPSAWLVLGVACLVLGADLLLGLAENGDGHSSEEIERMHRRRQLATALGILGTTSMLPDAFDPLTLDLAAPGAFGSFLAASGAGPAVPLPIPAPPAGADPLGSALRSYAERVGAPSPAFDAAQTPLGLRLGEDGRAAVSQLVEAYLLALRLNEEAVQTLSPQEILLLSGDAEAWRTWGETHAATSAAMAAELMSIGEQVDQERLLQAADVLARTADAVRGALVLRPLSEAAATAPADAADAGSGSTLHLLQAFVDLVDPDRAAPPTQRASLAQALGELAALYGQSPPAAAAQPALPSSLDRALATLVMAQVAGASSTPEDKARLVLDAMEAVTPTLSAWAELLEPSGAPRPLDVAGITSIVSAGPLPASGMLRAASGSPATGPVEAAPLPLLLAARGLSGPEATAVAASLPAPAAAAVALLLQAEDDLQARRDAVFAPLTPVQRLAVDATPWISPLFQLQEWTPEQAAVAGDWAAGIAAIGPGGIASLRDAQAAALQAAEQAAAILGTVPPLPGIAAQSPEEPPDGPGVPPSPGLPGSSGSQSSAPPATPTRPTTPPDPVCPVASPFSRCAQDVFLDLPQAGLLVTGRGSTRIDASLAGGDARIIVDLGGNDRYVVPTAVALGGIGVDGSLAAGIVAAAGLGNGGAYYGPWKQESATTGENLAGRRTFSAAVDAGGDDVYEVQSAHAQGVGSGLGTAGILIDVAGDDFYAQGLDPEAAEQFAQGVGANGGLGALLDLAGSDVYAATYASAQGVGHAAIALNEAMACGQDVCLLGNRPGQPQRDIGGTGILLDDGSGEDRLFARTGQASSHGYGSVAILLDRAGATEYHLAEPSLASQGGRDLAAAPGTIQTRPSPETPGSPGGIALLVDLGGPGDLYVSPLFPAPDSAEAEGTGWIRPAGREARKGDDTVWGDANRSLALGVDSSLEDHDGDLVPDLVELLAGSDPGDGASVPSDPASAASRLLAFVTSLAPVRPPSDSDGDSFPDDLEALVGSDPDDPSSRPGISQPPGFVLVAGSVCAPEPEQPAPGCAAAAQCDATRFACLRLLAVGGPGESVHDFESIVSVDLEGSDRYTSRVAGSGATTAGTFGSFSLDVAGDDRYETPALDRTQGFAQAGAASLLVDLAGNDRYEARSLSQGAVAERGLAVLLDVAGHDSYTSDSRSQSFVARDAPSDDAAAAALLDGGGDDRYTFETQAAVVGAPSDTLALLVDAGGTDTYSSVAIPAAPTGPTPTAPATIFESQGRLDRSGPGGSQMTLGLFLDAGTSADTYRTLTPGGGMADVSGAKNDAGLQRNPERGTVAPTGMPGTDGDLGTAAGYFLDGPASVGGDEDEDGWPWLAEALLGTDPKDADSVPVSEDTAGPWVLRLAPDASLLGSGGDNLVLPGLFIGGLGDTVYSQYIPFVVDLEGSDRYEAPNIGGAAAFLHHVQQSRSATTTPVTTSPTPLPRFAPAFILDRGAGDDNYAPRPCDVDVLGSATIRPSYDAAAELGAADGVFLGSGQQALAFCPSLGGTVGGVAVLADDGGSNVFTSHLDLAATGSQESSVSLHGWGVTQGASLFAGAGMLVTWDASNKFSANASVAAREAGEVNPTPRAFAAGVAQGAAWGHGIGVLASLGERPDEYQAGVQATAPWLNGDVGVPVSLAQAAAWSGTGMLLDGGGDNVFEARAGYAQAFATGRGRADQAVDSSAVHAAPLALLVSGGGRDTFVAGKASQASAGALDTTIPSGQERAPKAFLFDLGGSDEYRIESEAGPARVWPGCDGAGLCPPDLGSCPQGIPQCAVSHAAALGLGTAALVDWAGDDRYLAHGLAFAQGVATEAGVATLADASGDDTYTARDHAQGFASGSSAQAFMADLRGRDLYELEDFGQGFGKGYFLDGNGRDSYRYDGAKTPLAGEPGDGEDNDWVWGPDPVRYPGATGVGTDRGELDDALAAIAAAAGSQVTLRVMKDAALTQPLADGEHARGTIYLVADVTSTASVQRVSFLRDGGVFAQGSPPSPTSKRFVYAWDTTGAHEPIQDGVYGLEAAAYVGAPPPGPQTLLPDGLPVRSAVQDVPVNNPPTGSFVLSRDSVSPHVPATHADLGIVVGSDIGPDGAPAATRAVAVLKSPAGEWVAVDRLLPAGEHHFPVTAQCGPAACADGGYVLSILLRDSQGSQTELGDAALLVDGTPPVSAIALTTAAGTASGTTGVLIPWQVMDAGSGPSKVRVIALHEGGEFLSVERPAGDGAAVLDPVRNGEILHLVSVAVDGLGNSECPFVAANACFAYREEADPDHVRQVTVDLAAPTITDLQIGPDPIGAGAILSVRANVADGETALRSVRVALDGARTVAATEMGPGTSTTHATTLTILPGDPEETPFVVAVTAVDSADHSRVASVSGLLDSRAPRFGLPQVEYEMDGAVVPAGRPNATAVVRLAVLDARTSAVSVSASELGLDESESCLADGGAAWRCVVGIPEGAPDGTYNATVTAVDAAGNANETTAELVVDAGPTSMSAITVAGVGPDFLVLSWTTSKPATTEVRYGKTDALGDEATDARLTTTHVARIEGLAPVSTYRFQAVSRTASGVLAAAPVLVATTLSGLEVGLAALPAEVSGVVSVQVSVESLVGDEPADVVGSLQDAQGQASPIRVFSLTMAPGQRTAGFDTRQHADGVYVLRVQAGRGADVQTVDSAPIQVDNTAPVLVPVEPRPATLSGSALPRLDVHVTDPLRGTLPDLTTLQVKVDGVAAPFSSAAYQAAATESGSRRLAIQLTSPVSDGPHALAVSLRDRAGNEGTASWTVHFDLKGPTADGRPVVDLGGLTHARPGTLVGLRVNVTDLAGVASVQADLRPFGGGLVPLSASQDNWTVALPLPSTTPDGMASIPILATDTLGNGATVATANVPVDAVAPRFLQATAQAQGLTTVHVAARTSEPARMSVSIVGAPSAQTPLGLDHAVTLAGQGPGATIVVTLEAIDGAGNRVAKTLFVALPADTAPPSAVAGLAAVSDAEGAVTLSWTPATDNAGIDHYRIARRVALGNEPLEVDADQTSIELAESPGQTVTYAVSAVDVAGLEGPASEATVHVIALPRLRDPAFTPMEGAAGAPFTFTVEYSHGGGLPPDSVVLRYARHLFTLDRTSAAHDCAEGCTYGGQFELPALTVGAQAEPAMVEARLGGDSVALEVVPPLVLGSANNGVHSTDAKGAPGVPTLFLLAALAFALVLETRRKHR